jgi:Na+(H+)/acetate symporter ActP
MGFLKFLVIFFIVTYILGIIGRFLLKRYLKKAQQHFEQQKTQYQNQNKQEGDITIQKTNNSEKIINKSEGDYVDFEEIK